MSAIDDAAAEGARRTWAAGDYTKVAEQLRPASRAVVAQVGVEPGMDVLDVATGTGNAALLAAAEGARVTGVDLTPELLAIARMRADESGLAIDFLEGNALALPVPDAAFDRVLSVFGVMFAPDHRRAAAELWRVCRPGGVVAVAAWPPEGGMAPLFRALASEGPPPPPDFEAPQLWGTAEHLRTLFPAGQLSTSVEHVVFEHDSVEAWMAFGEQHAGPVVVAKAALEAAGRWTDLRERVVATAHELNEADDGSFRLTSPYLLATIRKPS